MSKSIVLPPKLYWSAARRSQRRTAQETPDAREQNGQLGRLGQIVVGAGSEAVEHVFRTTACGQDQHRHELTRLAQLGHHGEAVLPRQHDVEYHQVETAVRWIGELFERRLAGLDDCDAVALRFEIEAESLGQVLLVLDDQHARGAHARAARGSKSVNVLPRPVPALSA